MRHLLALIIPVAFLSALTGAQSRLIATEVPLFLAGGLTPGTSRSGLDAPAGRIVARWVGSGQDRDHAQ